MGILIPQNRISFVSSCILTLLKIGLVYPLFCISMSKNQERIKVVNQGTTEVLYGNSQLNKKLNAKISF